MLASDHFQANKILLYGTEDSDQSGYGHTDNTFHQPDQFSFGSGET